MINQPHVLAICNSVKGEIFFWGWTFSWALVER